MGTTESLLTGQSGVLVFEVPQTSKVASSATVQYRTPSTTFTEAASATVEAVNKTLNAANEGASAIVATTSAGITVGRSYVVFPSRASVVCNDGFKVTPLNDGTTLALKQPLPFAIESGSKLRACTISKSISADDTDIVGECYARWEITFDDGTKEVHHHAFYIHNSSASYALNTQKLFEAYPILRRLADANDKTLSQAISSAWEMGVRPVLEAKGLVVEKIIDQSRVMPFHAAVTARRMLEQNERTPIELVERHRDEEKSILNSMLAGVKFWYAPVENGDTKEVSRNSHVTHTLANTIRVRR